MDPVWATNKQTGRKLTCMSDSLHELEVFVVSGFQGLVAPKASSWGPICSSKQAPLILFKSSVLPPWRPDSLVMEGADESWVFPVSWESSVLVPPTCRVLGCYLEITQSRAETVFTAKKSANRYKCGFKFLASAWDNRCDAWSRSTNVRRQQVCT